MWAPELSAFSFSTFGLAWVAAAAGSLHCLGMCGPIRWIAGAGKGVPYQGGRFLAYLILGLAAGIFGAMLTPLLLIFLLAAALVVSALKLRPLGSAHSLRGRAVGRFAAHPFLLGLGTGLLPCGLLYGWIALAVATRNASEGALLLLALWLGTLPALELSTTLLRAPLQALRLRFPRALPLAFLLLAFLPIGARLVLPALAARTSAPASAPAHTLCAPASWLK